MQPLRRDIERAAAGAATPEGVRLLAELLGEDDSGARRTDDELGSLANRLGEGADLEAVEALARYGAGLPDALVLDAVQSAVLHGVPVASSDAAVKLWRERSAGSPLGRLPLERLAAEAALGLPGHGTRGSGVGGRRVQASSDALGIERIEPSSTVLPAVAGWIERSNGRFEWVEVQLTRPVESVGARQLIQLGLECLREATPERLVPMHEDVAGVFSVLFGAGLGGAYDCTPGLGQVRLASWTSLARLAGLDDEATPADIEAGAARHTWSSFAPCSPWFHQVAWDVGLVCLRAGGTHLSVFAATDTD